MAKLQNKHSLADSALAHLKLTTEQVIKIMSTDSESGFMFNPNNKYTYFQNGKPILSVPDGYFMTQTIWTGYQPPIHAEPGLLDCDCDLGHVNDIWVSNLIQKF